MTHTFYVDNTAYIKNVAGENNAKIYKNCHVENTSLKENSSIGDYSRVFNSTIGEHVAIQRNAQIYDSCFGRYSYTGKNVTVMHSEIGAFCSISWNVSIGGANHDYSRVTTHSFLYGENYHFFDDSPGYDRFSDSCIIGNDVWIAANACVCRGVTIGDGAVVGAGTVVTHDVEPYTIVGGVPARPIKKRFPEGICSLLQETKWWELPEEVIKNNFDLFNSVPTKEIVEKISALRKNLNERKKQGI